MDFETVLTREETKEEDNPLKLSLEDLALEENSDERSNQVQDLQSSLDSTKQLFIRIVETLDPVNPTQINQTAFSMLIPKIFIKSAFIFLLFYFIFVFLSNPLYLLMVLFVLHHCLTQSLDIFKM